MFGRGRFYPGVVVDPKPEFRFDPMDETALSDFRNLIWWVTPFIDLQVVDTEREETERKLTAKL